MNKNQAWEDEDQEFDEELERKHQEIILEDLYSNKNIPSETVPKTSHRNHNLKEKKRESFDIDIEHLVRNKISAIEESELSLVRDNDSPILPKENMNVQDFDEESDVV